MSGLLFLCVFIMHNSPRDKKIIIAKCGIREFSIKISGSVSVDINCEKTALLIAASTSTLCNRATQWKSSLSCWGCDHNYKSRWWLLVYWETWAVQKVGKQNERQIGEDIWTPCHFISTQQCEHATITILIYNGCSTLNRTCPNWWYARILWSLI